MDIEGDPTGPLGSSSPFKPECFHVMLKPAGASCNLNCSYCYYLGKGSLYPGERTRMTPELLEECIRQLSEARRSAHVTVAWQGGEPTLMGIDFFRTAIELERKYARTGMTFENTFQTNGILLNEEWCELFRENGFLVGVSLDGPKEVHDIYRKDRSGRGTFERVVSGIRLLQDHGVDHNILATVNRANSKHPLETYRFLRDDIGAENIQFIPVVEKGGNSVTAESVRPLQWGRFLIGIFDEWIARDVGIVFVLNFEGFLAGWMGRPNALCAFGPTCGLGLALEHNGDLYSCDHFVDPDHKLGNIRETSLIEMVCSERQRTFGLQKRKCLADFCLKCEYLSVCNGECPKNRFPTTAEGETINYLCSGYRRFFRHAGPHFRTMASLLLTGRSASEIMPILAQGGDEPRGHGAVRERTRKY